MRIPIFQVDAFTDELFGGNPAAVCPLEAAIPDATQQAIALENQLSETAFLLPDGEGFTLRWFTPEAEVTLCGHATLAAGHVVLTELQSGRTSVHFQTASGVLAVERAESGYHLDLPAWPGEAIPVPEVLSVALGVAPVAVRRTERDLYAMLENEAQVRSLTPDFPALAALRTGDLRADAVGVAAPGDSVDIVSRFFAPALGIDEDPVTGSAHSTWIPWFAEKLGRTRLHAQQLSRRGGSLVGEHIADRVRLEGRCVTYLRGEIEV